MLKFEIKLILIISLVILSIGKKSFGQSGLSIHGHLSQAFAISDKYQIFGIPKDGTADYRSLALQFRYDINEYNTSIIQLSHRRIGLSPLKELEKDVVLDWAFFEHKFTQNIGFKVGKILIPFGLYNEIRDVGILLPFYRPPYTPYTMGSYLSETVNGVSVFYTRSYDGYEINLDIYSGNWEWKLWFNQSNLYDNGFSTIIDVSTVENAIGARLSVACPQNNIYGGLSWQSGDVSGEYFFGTKYNGVRAQSFNILNVYMDYNNELFYLKPEYTITLFRQGDFYIDGVSITSGINIIYGLSFNMSYEMIEINHVPVYSSPSSNVILNRENSKYLKDGAAGLNFKFSSYVILKSELHFNRSLAVEDIYKNVLSEKPVDIKYFILSLATSF